jgi:hypothetical protein
MSKETFSDKYIIWMTDKLDQALIHPLERDLRNPIFFKFRLKEDIYVLDSKNRDNNWIFDNLLQKIDKNILVTNTVLLDNLKKVLRIDDFKYTDNVNILYILEAINEIINEQEYKIHGYKNTLDQKEIALLNFRDLVDINSIVKYNYTKITLNGKDINISDGKKINSYLPSKIIFYKEMKNGSYRMRCEGEDIQLYYEIEDKSEIEQVFNCKDKDEEYFYAGKYKKYKQKYLELKKIL